MRLLLIYDYRILYQTERNGKQRSNDRTSSYNEWTAAIKVMITITGKATTVPYSVYLPSRIGTSTYNELTYVVQVMIVMTGKVTTLALF